MTPTGETTETCYLCNAPAVSVEPYGGGSAWLCEACGGTPAPAGADDQTPDPWEVAFNEQAQTCPCLYFGDEAPLCVQRGGCQGWAPYPVATGPAVKRPEDLVGTHGARRFEVQWRGRQHAVVDTYDEAIGIARGLLGLPVEPIDGCVRCAQPAELTIRIGSGDLLRLCRSCFDTHYERNEDCKTSWEVVEPEPEPEPAPNRYEQRMAARRERLERMAAAASGEASRRITAARAIGAQIPMGQPILVGHHSERRHRRDIERIDANMRKGVDALDRAEELRAAAAAVGTGGISADDPEALVKLQGKLAGQKERHALMVATNKAWRVKEPAKRQAALLALGHIEGTVARFMGSATQPYAAYELSNSTGRIKGTEERIAQLQAAQQREQTFQPAQGEGWRLYAEDGRICIAFDERQPAERVVELKGRGFKWLPSRSAWVRQFTPNAVYAARSLLGLV